MIGGFEMVLQYACLARPAKYTDSGDTWDWEPGELVKPLDQPDAQTITFVSKMGIIWYDGSSHEEIGELNAEDVKYSLKSMKFSGWKDEEFDLLFQAGLCETDTARQHDIYVRTQEGMEDTGGYVFLMFPPNGVMYREGFEPVITPHGYNIWQTQHFVWP